MLFSTDTVFDLLGNGTNSFAVRPAECVERLYVFDFPGRRTKCNGNTILGQHSSEGLVWVGEGTHILREKRFLVPSAECVERLSDNDFLSGRVYSVKVFKVTEHRY